MKLVHSAVAAAIIGLQAIPGTAQAVPVTRSATIVNHSFEVGSTVINGGHDFSNIVGWESFSAAYLNPNAAQFANEAPDGIYVVRGGSLSQELNEVLVAGPVPINSRSISDA